MHLVARVGLVLLAAFCLPLASGCKSSGGGGAAPPPKAAAAGWVLLGERRVDFGADRDTIMVTGAEGTFRKLHLRVKQRGVQFADMKVHFGNGNVHDVSIRNFIKKGGQTRVIDLPGKARIIKKVVFWYKSKKKAKGKGKAHIRLFGKH